MANRNQNPQAPASQPVPPTDYGIRGIPESDLILGTGLAREYDSTALFAELDRRALIILPRLSEAENSLLAAGLASYDRASVIGRALAMEAAKRIALLL